MKPIENNIVLIVGVNILVVNAVDVFDWAKNLSG
jgi:hypothetical protein